MLFANEKWVGSLPVMVLAVDIASAVNLTIAILTLCTIIAGGVWRLRLALKKDREQLRTDMRGDMEAITKRHVDPIATSQQEAVEMLKRHDEALFGKDGYGEQIAFLRGKAEARTEIAQTASLAASAAAALISEVKEKEKQP